MPSNERRSGQWLFRAIRIIILNQSNNSDWSPEFFSNKQLSFVDRMFEIGETILSDLEGQEIDTYTFPLRMKAKTLAVKPDIIIDGHVKQIDSDLLFQRLSVCNSMKSEHERRAAFDYELCSSAPNLFDNKLLMRSGNKSEMSDCLWKMVAPNLLPTITPRRAPRNNSVRHIVDGGSLIHRIPWTKKHMTWGELFLTIFTYVKNVYCMSASIWFDGYMKALPQRMRQISKEQAQKPLQTLL